MVDELPISAHPTSPETRVRHGVHEFWLNCADSRNIILLNWDSNVSLFVHMSLVFEEFLMSRVVHLSVHSQGHRKLESGMNFIVNF